MIKKIKHLNIQDLAYIRSVLTCNINTSEQLLDLLKYDELWLDKIGIDIENMKYKLYVIQQLFDFVEADEDEETA